MTQEGKTGAQSEAWENVLASLCRLQEVLPDTVLVGGTASALYAGHRISLDHDHVLLDLRERFDTVLAELESVAGWETARVKRPVLIDGVDNWDHVAEVCGEVSDQLLGACVRALQTDPWPEARRSHLKIDALRDSLAAAQGSQPPKLPGLET